MQCYNYSKGEGLGKRREKEEEEKEEEEEEEKILRSRAAPPSGRQPKIHHF